MKKRVLVFFLAVLTVLGTAACGRVTAPEKSAPKSDEAKVSSQQSETEEKETDAGKEPAQDADSHLNYLRSARFFTNEVSLAHCYGGGILYKSGEKYGVLSLDGKKDSGAIYSSCEAVLKFFEVSVRTDAMEPNADSVNRFGLVDGQGKVLIPMEYALIKSLAGGRFFRAFRATETTESDDYQIYLSKNIFSLSASADDVKFKADWVIFDAQTGKEVPGAAGNDRSEAYAHGGFVEFRKNGEDITVFPDGKILDRQKYRLLDNGVYIEENQGTASVYDVDGKKLFSYNTGEFTMHGYFQSGDDGYYVVYRRVQNNTKSEYALMDLSGKIISTYYDSSPVKIGSFVIAGAALMDLEGKKILDGEFSRGEYDEQLGRLYYFTKKDGDHYNRYLFTDAIGKILLDVKNEDLYSVYPSDFYAEKKIGSDRFVFSYADQDYTVKGAKRALNGMVSVDDENGSDDLIDLVTGKTVLKDYASYDSIETDEGLLLSAKKYENDSITIDLYQVVK